MPRRGGGGASRPAARRAPAPPPRPAAKSAPPPAPAPQSSGGGGGMMGGMAGMVMQGMAMGTGSAIAHRAVGAVMGPTSSYGTSAAPEAGGEATPAAPADPCGNQRTAFSACIEQNGSDINQCQSYVDMLQACKRGEPV